MKNQHDRKHDECNHREHGDVCHHHHHHHEHEPHECCEHAQEDHHGHGKCGCHGHHEHTHSGCGCGHDHEHEHEPGDSCGCGHDHVHGREGKSKKALILRYGLGAIPVVIGFLGFLPVPVAVVAAVAGYLLFGFEVWRDMLRGFGRKQIFTEFTLMCVASFGAFAIGEYADGAAVMYLYSLGETLSSGAYVRSKKNISELLAMTPETATVIREGQPRAVDPKTVEVGETILAVSGERVPLDGVVVHGGGTADASSVTGESKPLELYEGVACPSGAVISDGTVYLKVSAVYENSVVAKLAEAVTAASSRKSAAEKKITRFARVFTPVAFGIAAAVCLVGTLITGELAVWLRAALVILVVSCPCSLVLSVPLTYFAGIGRGAADGIIFRGGEIMDSMCRLSAIAFDKTGTLTESGLHFDGADRYTDLSEEEFLSLSYDVLVHSPHTAAVSFCQSYGGTVTHAVADVKNVGGRGVRAVVDEKIAYFGNGAWMRQNGISCEDCSTTVIFGAWDGVLVGRLNFSSHLKDGSRDLVECLQREGVSRIAVLSGDGVESVAEACRHAGIEEYYGTLTPSEKVETFDRICREEKAKRADATVAYCGDGLNDSAVIAGADIGIAMGGCGSALTVTSADVVLMDDDPKKVHRAMRIAKRTAKIAGQNIVLSLGIKVAVLIVGVILSALTGEGIPMGLAIVADVGAAVLAVLNALRASKK